MRMNNQMEKKSGGHFFNGFFWGAALGGGFAYILSTKRGRELLKDLVQDGLDMLDDLTLEPEVAEEELSPIEENAANKPADVPLMEHSVSAEKQSEQPVKKRFFRAGKK